MFHRVKLPKFSAFQNIFILAMTNLANVAFQDKVHK